MSAARDLVKEAEARWLEGWSSGPTEGEGTGLVAGALAPDLVLLDQEGADRSLSEFWADGPALVMFWRHFGCTCGHERARRLVTEYAAYREAGLTPVIVSQGDPGRAAEYGAAHDLPCPVLCDPELAAYRAYGVGQWPVERVLFDAPPDFWDHDRELGESFQESRRQEGRAPVDDPWRAVAEYVVGLDGRVRLPYRYQYCEDFPDPRVLTTAARLA
jgi:peroxiredoxin